MKSSYCWCVALALTVLSANSALAGPRNAVTPPTGFSVLGKINPTPGAIPQTPKTTVPVAPVARAAVGGPPVAASAPGNAGRTSATGNGLGVSGTGMVRPGAPAAVGGPTRTVAGAISGNSVPARRP
jgi:hypothetical protein